MSWWMERFKRKSNPPAQVPTIAVRHIGDVEAPEKFRNSALRRRATSHYSSEQPPTLGMWLTYAGRTGVLAALGTNDMATINVAAPDGTNTGESLHVVAGSTRQAYWEEIPAPRRPDLATALSFGYARKP